MSKNKELKELYIKYWDQLVMNGNNIFKDKSIIKNKPTNPLFLKVNEDEFETSDLKVMIFGQETWGWNQFGVSVEEGMNRYESFYVKEGFYKGRT